MIRRWVPWWAVAGILVFSVGTVWLRLMVVRSTYEINQISKELTNTQQEKDQLEVKVAQLRSPKRLEILARNQFGLQPPESHQVIQMTGSTSGQNSVGSDKP